MELYSFHSVTMITAIGVLFDMIIIFEEIFIDIWILSVFTLFH